MSEFNLNHLKADERAILTYHLKRREAQTCPEPRPFIWFLMAGRGAGKTWTSANHIFEYARQLALTLPRSQENDVIRCALVGQNFSDVRGTMMEGQSGLLSIIPKELQVKYNRTNCELWVSIPSADRILYFQGFTSQVPDKLRGPQFHIAWLDEPAKFEDADEEPMATNTTWSNLIMCTRLGFQVNAPHIVVSGTPTSCKLVRYLMDHEDSVVTHSTTIENYDNLPESYQREIANMNKESRTYQQEILGKVLVENQNAVFTENTIDHGRCLPPKPEDCKNGFHRVLGWDPSVGTSDEGDEAGIIIVGYTPEVKEKRGARGGKPIILEPAHAYVLEDLSGHISPYDQAELIIDKILEDRIGDLVFETNQGADVLITMLEQVIKQKAETYTIRREKKRRREDYGSIARFQIQITWKPDPDNSDETQVHKFTASGVHVSQNKRTRAETAAMKYDQKQVHHPPANTLPKCPKDMCKASLEQQMIAWNPEKAKNNSPDRLDALVYALFLIFGVGGKKVGSNTIFTAPTGGGTYATDPGQGSQIQQQGRKKKHASIYSQDLANGRQTGSDPMRGSGWAVPVYNDPIDRLKGY